MSVRRFLALLSGFLACLITALAFRLFPVDLSTPVTWLWIPLFAGTIFVNSFGLAALTLMVPWEIITHYFPRGRKLQIIDEKTGHRLDEVTTTAPALPREQVA